MRLAKSIDDTHLRSIADRLTPQWNYPLLERSSIQEVMLLAERPSIWEKGELYEARRVSIRLEEKRFGLRDPSTVERIEGIEGTRAFGRVAKIELMIERLPDMASWEGLLASISGPE